LQKISKEDQRVSKYVVENQVTQRLTAMDSRLAFHLGALAMLQLILHVCVALTLVVLYFVSKWHVVEV
jgi:hypothetical protein